MKFKIPILLSSIRENPQAGEPYYVPGRIICNPDGSTTQSMTPVHELGSEGQPTHYFGYVTEVEVQCSHCNFRCNWTELKYIAEDWDDDGHCDPGIEDICPSCGTEDCCELEMESLADALKRQGGK